LDTKHNNGLRNVNEEQLIEFPQTILKAKNKEEGRKLEKVKHQFPMKVCIRMHPHIVGMASTVCI